MSKTPCSRLLCLAPSQAITNDTGVGENLHLCNVIYHIINCILLDRVRCGGATGRALDLQSTSSSGQKLRNSLGQVFTPM